MVKENIAAPAQGNINHFDAKELCAHYGIEEGNIHCASKIASEITEIMMKDSPEGQISSASATAIGTLIALQINKASR